ncbi:hypothetical protein BDV98DRAFT_609129 [Pterulicium gracile]|uniref:Transmembrane protein n=1 Tax=Pterulicium gracile TaxID=1884261 RepID=A0A5C3Q4H5_9AGAR|nr:hypothetical protein BDV98DRAFT_609129 [Pterula gracilis]
MNAKSTQLDLYSDSVEPVTCRDGNVNQEEKECRFRAFGRVFTKITGLNTDPDGEDDKDRQSFNLVLNVGPGPRQTKLLHERSGFANQDEVMYLAVHDTLDLAPFFAVVAPPKGERFQAGTQVFVDARGSDSSGATCAELAGGETQLAVHFTGSSLSVVVAESITPVGIPYQLKMNGANVPGTLTLTGNSWKLNGNITAHPTNDSDSTHAAVFYYRHEPVKSSTILGLVYSPPISPDFTFNDLPINIFHTSPEGSAPAPPRGSPSPGSDLGPIGVSKASEPTDSSGSSARSPNVGIMLGGVFGGVALFVFGLVIGVWFMGRRWRQRQSPSAQFYATAADIGYDQPPQGSSSPNDLAKYSTQEKAERFPGSTLVGSIFHSRKVSFNWPSQPVIPADAPAMANDQRPHQPRTALNPFPTPRSTAAPSTSVVSNGSIAPSSTRYPVRRTWICRRIDCRGTGRMMGILGGETSWWRMRFEP